MEKGKNPLLGEDNTHIDELGIEILTSNDGALARISGRVDMDSSPALRERLLGLWEAPPSRVVSIDLSAVTHIDSSGIATLVEALRIARTRHSEVRLQGLEGRLLRLFQSTGILSLFNANTLTNTYSGSKGV